MAAWRPELLTKDAVLSYYENSDLVRYKVYAGTKPDYNSIRWEHDGAKDEGIQILSQACDAILANPQNINSYCLQLLRSEKKIPTGSHGNSRKVEDSVNIVFQLNFQNNIVPMQSNMQIVGAGSNRMEQMLEKMIEGQNALTSLITAKMQQDMEEIEEEESEVIGSSSNPLYKLLENPQIQGLIIEKISGFFTTKKPAAIAGIANDETQLQQAIEILKRHDDQLSNDLMKLATIAETNKPQFDMLLTVLRSNFN